MVDKGLVPQVPAEQHDFGCRDALIGGVPALKRIPARPRWRVCRFFASRAEPGSDSNQ
jgi:hypothetical protein